LSLTDGRAGESPEALLRDERRQPCFAREGSTSMSVVAEFPEPRTFNNLVVEEFLEQGQRISAFALDAWQDGRWTPVAEGRTVGRKRVLPFGDTTAEKVRFRVIAARDQPALRFLGVYQALPYHEATRTFADAEYRPALPERDNLQPGLGWSFYEDANNGFLPYQELFSDLRTTKVTAVATGLAANPMEAASAVPRGRQRKEHFTMRFDGYFRAPSRAVYSFRARANTGCRLYLDGRPLIENDGAGGINGGAKTAELPLQAGLHELTVLYYFGSAGEPKLNLVVAWPGNVGGDGFGWSSSQRLLPLLWSEASRVPAGK